MKHTLNTIAILTATIISSHAATITMDTASFVSDSESTNIPKGSGVVSIGTYNAFPVLGASPTNSEVTDSYFELSLGTFDSPLVSDGFFRFDLDVPISNFFNNKDIFVVLGNGTTVQDSTDLLVWQPTSNADGNVFIEDNPIGGPGSIVLNNDNGNVLLGSFDSDANTFRMASLATVPEPSSMALSSLALLALAGRRSRK
ncbi:MAG: PEP-CTERM sorting domain-containing protein [Akkermansiaceae bacterium]